MPSNPTTISRLAVILLSLQSHFCLGQSAPDGQTFYDKEYKWSISIPKGFERIPDSTEAKIQKKGLDAIEKTYGGNVANKAKIICAFKSDQLHYFEANTQSNNSGNKDSYDKSFKDVSDVLYHTFEANMPKARLDSSYGRERISGKEFHVFQAYVHITPQVTMRVLMFSRLFGKKEFTATIIYVKEEIGKQLLDAWRNSRFEE